MKARGWRRIAVATWGHPNDPQIYGDIEVDAEALESFLVRAREVSGVRITVTHLVGKAIAYALAQQPEVNARLVHGSFMPRGSVDVFFIVAAGGGQDLSGVKVVGVDTKPVVELAEELRAKVDRVRVGDDGSFDRGKRILDALPIWLLGPLLRLTAWLTGERNVDLRNLGMPRQPFGSAMVSSVGVFGIQKAYGPLSPLYRVPILALVGEITPRPVVVDGDVVARPILTISATLDHRYLDGAHAARLARSVRAYLEDPAAFEPDLAEAVAVPGEPM